MNIPLTIEDVLFAAVLAAVIVFVLHYVSRAFLGLITKRMTFSIGARRLTPEQMEMVLQRFYRLFPVESLTWQGTTFNRGTDMRIKTDRDDIYEGKFIGLNNEGLVCIITGDCVIAQQMINIVEIKGK